MLQCDPLHSKRRSSREETLERASFVVLNDKGLHTRPSTELVKCTSQFNATINLTYGEMTVNAKSILGILMLAASKGTELHVEAQGADAKEAIEAILRLASNKFYTSY